MRFDFSELDLQGARLDPLNQLEGRVRGVDASIDCPGDNSPAGKKDFVGEGPFVFACLR